MSEPICATLNLSKYKSHASQSAFFFSSLKSRFEGLRCGEKPYKIDFGTKNVERRQITAEKGKPTSNPPLTYLRGPL